MSITATIKFAAAPRPHSLSNGKRSSTPHVEYVDFLKRRISFPLYMIELAKRAPKHGGIINSKVDYIVGEGIESKFNFNSILRQIVVDLETQGGFYIEVIKSKTGKVLDLVHIPFEKVVRSQDKASWWYGDNAYTLSNTNTLIPLVPFGEDNPNNAREFIFYHDYTSGYDLYPSPRYIHGLDYINTEYLVSNHTYTNAKKGFKPTKHVTLVNGEPSKEVKQSVKRKFEDTYQGENGETVIIDFVSSPDRAAIIADLGASDLTKEDYTSVNELVSSNIFTAHSVTTPELFGISTPGQLGNTSQLRDAYEIFTNTYVKSQRKKVIDIFEKILKVMNLDTELTWTSSQIIGVQIPESLLVQYLPEDYILDRLGIKKDIATVKMNSQDEKVSLSDENVIKEFASVEMRAAVSDLDEILTLIYENSTLTIDDLVNLTGYDEKYISKAIDQLIAEGTISGKPGAYIVNAKSYNDKYEVLYSYEWRPEIPVAERNTKDHPSRNFCVRMMELGKLYRASDIEKISSKLGYDVFTRQGGWWNSNGETKAHCRHKWMARTYKKVAK